MSEPGLKPTSQSQGIMPSHGHGLVEMAKKSGSCKKKRVVSTEIAISQSLKRQEGDWPD